jgi:DNA-binding transcriptional LysR family regulator
LSVFHARHPDIQVELAPQPRVVNLSKREADIAVSLNRPPQGRLYTQKLLDFTLGLYASRGYIEAEGTIEHIDALKDRPFVWYIDELIEVEELRYLDQLSTTVRIVFRSSSLAAQQAAIGAGLGFGILHVFAAEQDPRLVRVLADSFALERSYWLTLHADQRRLPRVRAVVDFLHQLVHERRGHF